MILLLLNAHLRRQESLDFKFLFAEPKFILYFCVLFLCALSRQLGIVFMCTSVALYRTDCNSSIFQPYFGLMITLSAARHVVTVRSSISQELEHLFQAYVLQHVQYRFDFCAPRCSGFRLFLSIHFNTVPPPHNFCVGLWRIGTRRSVW